MNISGSKRVRLQVDHVSAEELNDIQLQGKQLIRVRHKKRRSKNRYVLIGLLLFLVLAGLISSLGGLLLYNTYNTRYHTDLSLAQTGIQHLQKAETLLASWSKRPLDTQLPKQAASEFGSANKTFDQLNSDLKSLPGAIQQIPKYGARLSSALRILPLAITLSQAGVAGCNILNTLTAGLHDPLTSQSNGITQADLAAVSKNVQELRSAFALASNQMNQLQPGDLQFDARIPTFIATFHKELPIIQGWLDTFQQILPVAPTLLGISTPANYLIEMMDTTELRPGGGFIGNYGIATFSGGRLASAHITDVDLLDRPFEAAGGMIPYPPAYTWFDIGGSSWSFRDSNLDADFPTAARYGEATYKDEGGNVAVQGVIAMTPGLIEQAFTVTGPIYVPEYHETVTAKNLIDRIHHYQLGAHHGSDLVPSPDGHSSLRKRFTELLAEHFLARVRQLPPADLSKLLLNMVNAVRSKDLQIYLNSNIAENLLHRFQLDAAIQSPVGDSLFVVDANIDANKANDLILSTLDDQVTIDGQGNVIHHTTLRYSWTLPGQNYGNPLYRDFVHVYVPPGSILLQQDGWQPRGTGNAFNRQIWMGYFELYYGHSLTVTLDWKVPKGASKDQNGGHYQYLIQRQAGVLWKVNLHIELPSCAAIVNKVGGLTSNGRQEAALNQSLTEDMNVGIGYVCK